MFPRAIFFGLLVCCSMAAQFEIKMPKARPLESDQYFCTAQKMDGDTKYLTSFQPVDHEHAHHIILFACKDAPGSEKPFWNCGHGKGSVCNGGTNIIMPWAMDAPGYEVPADSSFAVGKNTKNRILVLQVHYKNVEDFKQDPTLRDETSMKITMSYEPTPNLMEVLLLASGYAVMPAHTPTTLTASCMKTGPIPLKPLSFRVHAHFLSDLIYGTVTRGGEVMLIGENSPKKPQTFYDVSDQCPAYILRGDRLDAYCQMNNNLDRDVQIGSDAKDEMCNFYLMYSVAKEQHQYLNSSDTFCF